MSVPTFLERSNHRSVPAGYSGDVLIWDIDKTYLDTRFSSVRGLLGIFAEAALDKRAIPGSVPLLRALRRGPNPETALVPLYFVSGSPPQLRSILERKMLLDGVQHDGITFKDQWGYVKARRLRAIKEQVGYKMCALLLYRLDVPGPSHWWLFGDDVEADAAVMTLFGEVCAGLRGEPLRERMLAMGGAPPETAAAVELAAGLAVTPNPVEKVFIRMEKSASAAAFPQHNVCAVKSYLQAALVLAGRGRISNLDLRAVAEDHRRSHLPESVLREHAQDAVDRLGVDAALLHFVQR